MSDNTQTPDDTYADFVKNLRGRRTETLSRTLKARNDIQGILDLLNFDCTELTPEQQYHLWNALSEIDTAISRDLPRIISLLRNLRAPTQQTKT